MKAKEGGVMDLQKEMQICSKEFEERWNVFCETHGSGHNKSVAKYFFFSSWQQAKAWVVPEGFVLVPVETLDEALSWANCAASETWTDEQREEIDKHYEVIEKAMIEAQEPAND